VETRYEPIFIPAIFEWTSFALSHLFKVTALPPCLFTDRATTHATVPKREERYCVCYYEGLNFSRSQSSRERDMARTLRHIIVAQSIYAAAVRSEYVSEYKVMEGHDVMNDYSLPLPSTYLSDDVRTYEYMQFIQAIIHTLKSHSLISIITFLLTSAHMVRVTLL